MRIEPIDVAAPAGRDLAPGLRELRRFIRRNIHARGTIRFGRRRHPVRLENLSEQGCQFWLPLRAGLPKGAQITLYIETLGPFDATVRWYREGWTGIEFDLPVYPPVLAHIHDTFDRGGSR